MVKFLLKMFHPNVYANGELCLDKHQVLSFAQRRRRGLRNHPFPGTAVWINTSDLDDAYLSAQHPFQEGSDPASLGRESLCAVSLNACSVLVTISYSNGFRILGMPEYRMAEGKRLQWWEEVPGAPCLVNFDGTHGERLVENVRLFEGLGAERYGRAAGQAGHRADPKALAIQSVIRSEFTGPNCFWKPHNAADLVGVTTFFGRADVVPFPFTVVFKYDQRPADPVCISTPADLHASVAQNQNTQVQMRRKARLVLRALENKIVFAPISVPWEAVLQATLKNRRWPWWLQGARSDVQFRSGVLRIHWNCQNE
ncbi:hypothetical protein PtB15_10B328 [Puccinia triticina]|nr:hypothetical protein PtB15_10B328 [Puccinia triticina]